MRYAKSQNIEVWKSIVADLQSYKVLTLLKPLKKMFLRAYNSRQHKYHMGIFHYFENRLGKASNFRKNLCDLLATFRYRGSKMGQYVLFGIFGAKFLCGSPFSVFFSETEAHS